MNRTNTIKYAIETFGYKRYLELGCENNNNFNQIKCDYKVGVDMIKGGTHRMSTDDFFASNNETFDVIFIDACHHHDQVYKDFDNSLKVLEKGGMIIMHDCNPHNERYESQDRCGTVWRVMVRHIRSNQELDSIVGDYDHGVGIVKVRKNTNALNIDKSMNDLCYTDLVNNRKNWLKLLSWKEVLEWIKSLNYWVIYDNLFPL